jgi:sugar phosphate isomerase/epimerase
MLATACAAGAALSTIRAADQPKEVWPFYAFDNGLKSKSVATLEAKCKLLKDLGYRGLQYHLNPKEMPRMYEQLDKHGLKMFGVYVVLPLSDGPVDKRLAESIKLMKGRDTNIDLGITSKKIKRSDPAGDATAKVMLKKIVDLCADTGPRISIYPHTGFWTERVEDGARLAKLVDPKMVGTNFNLVHWSWVKQTRDVKDVLKECLPNLFSVTFNGLKGKGARPRIMPLDESDYDLEKFLATVKEIGYTGSVGLQCWSIKAPSEENLKRSMTRWLEMKKKLGVD